MSPTSSGQTMRDVVDPRATLSWNLLSHSDQPGGGLVNDSGGGPDEDDSLAPDGGPQYGDIESVQAEQYLTSVSDGSI